MQSLWREALLLPALVLAACKAELRVPEHGRVVSESTAIRCEAQSKCLVDLVDVHCRRVTHSKQTGQSASLPCVDGSKRGTDYRYDSDGTLFASIDWVDGEQLSS